MKRLMCRACNGANLPEAFVCVQCGESLVIGRLVSLGNGVLARGAVFEVRSTDFAIGRASSNQIVVDSNLVAPEQLRLSYVGGSFHVVDVEGRGRSQCNGVKIEGSQPLRDGDRLDLAVESFVYSEEPLASLDGSSVAGYRFMLGALAEMQLAFDTNELVTAATDAVIQLCQASKAILFTFDDAGVLRQELARAPGMVSLGKVTHTITPLLLERIHHGQEAVVLMERELLQQPPSDPHVKMLAFVPMRAIHPHTGKRSLNGLIYAESGRPVHTMPQVARPMLQMLGQLFTVAYGRSVGHETELQGAYGLRRTRDAIKHELSRAITQLEQGDSEALSSSLQQCRTLVDSGLRSE